MESNIAPQGMVVTPHHLATQSALAILREGGTAMEATVAAAATISVVYPHMNSIGGDGFWLIIPPNDDPIVIEGSGTAGSLANIDFFKGFKQIPYKGPKAALTVAGTIGGWQEALKYTSECGYHRKSLQRLLEDAIMYAEQGVPVTLSLEYAIDVFLKNEKVSKEFADIFSPYGRALKTGEIFYQKKLANTLKTLVDQGLDSFYRGNVAKVIAEDMNSLGMPITEADLNNYAPIRKIPLRLLHSQGEIFNTPPPTQGLVSLAILGMLDKAKVDGKNEGEFIHFVVEATKQAFKMRDENITDPSCMKVDPKELISDGAINKMVKNILPSVAGTGAGKGPGDTIWLGVMDNKGFSVSFIQSVYHMFGSGVILPQTGIIWQNRGTAFSLDPDHILSLKPGKKPFHTLNPAAAKLKDGRVMVYGTRGGDGQVQTQAAIFHRYVVQGLPLQQSVSLPRWIYGRTLGDHNQTLKLENRISETSVQYLKSRGHQIEMLPAYSEQVGQAGALVRLPNGMMEGAFDPRSNGSAAGF